MPDKMTIRIRVEKIDDTTYQTVSTFAIDEKGHVSFINKANKVANVKFKEKSPFCQGNDNREDPSFDIQPGATSVHKVCKDIAESEFKYTATVLDALPEDPILIVEKAVYGGGNSANSIVWGAMLPWVIAAFIAGAVGAYFVMRRRTTGK